MGLRGSRGGGERLQYEAPNVPVVEVALPSQERDGNFTRDLFSPPSDTESLAVLTLATPPLDPLPSLAPPAAFGPIAALRNLPVVALQRRFRALRSGRIRAPRSVRGSSAAC